jgi:hypothetical protein
MKRFLTLCCIVLLVLTATAFALWMALPSVSTYLGSQLLGKAIGGKVQIGHVEPHYRNGAIILDLHDLTMTGTVEGTIKDGHLEFNPWKGLYIVAANISDFDINIKDSGGRIGLVPAPVEQAELRRGTVTYRGQKYTVRELKVKNFNTGGNLEFEFDGGAEGLGNLKTKGGGNWEVFKR